MGESESFTIGRWLFLAGALVYLVLTVQTVKQAKDQPVWLILLGLLTVVVSIWFGGLPQRGAVRVGEAGINVSAMMADFGPAVLSRVGVILVLAGLAGFLLRPEEKVEPPKSSGGAS